MTRVRPAEFEPDRPELVHANRNYDPVKAHEYYMRTRKLKGRKKGSDEEPKSGNDSSAKGSSTKGKETKSKPTYSPSLQTKIANLKDRLAKLQARLREINQSSSNAKGSKEKTAAEKAESARDSKAYRRKNKAKIAAQAKKADAKKGPTPIGSMSKTQVQSAIRETKVTLLKTVADARKSAQKR